MVVVFALVLGAFTTAPIKTPPEIYMEGCFIYEYIITCEIQVSLHPSFNQFVALFNFSGLFLSTDF